MTILLSIYLFEFMTQWGIRDRSVGDSLLSGGVAALFALLLTTGIGGTNIPMDD